MQQLIIPAGMGQAGAGGGTGGGRAFRGSGGHSPTALGEALRVQPWGSGAWEGSEVWAQQQPSGDPQGCRSPGPVTGSLPYLAGAMSGFMPVGGPGQGCLTTAKGKEVSARPPGVCPGHAQPPPRDSCAQGLTGIRARHCKALPVLLPGKVGSWLSGLGLPQPRDTGTDREGTQSAGLGAPQWAGAAAPQASDQGPPASTSRPRPSHWAPFPLPWMETSHQPDQSPNRAST